SPVVLVPEQLMSAPRNTSVTLECRVEAFPKAVTFWRYNENMIMNTNKYMLQESTNEYKTRVKLTINHLGGEDFGTYQCYSRNSFGENDGTVNLHELLPPVIKEPLNNHIHQGEKNEEIIQHVPTEHERSRSQNQVIMEADAEGGLMTSSNTNDEISMNEMNFEHNSKLNRERGSLYDFDFISDTSGSARPHHHQSATNLSLLLLLLLAPILIHVRLIHR
ncbi:unnamed protein product, partial [Meganyctiphanes norvegica]